MHYIKCFPIGLKRQLLAGVSGFFFLCGGKKNAVKLNIWESVIHHMDSIDILQKFHGK